MPPDDIPGKIAVPEGHKPFLVAHAVGDQICTCNAVGDAYAWSPATPRADLDGDNGKLIGTHFGGHTWRANDGSSFVGQRADGAIVDATAIPWLLLSRVTSSAGPDGDRFAGATYIQRINTTDGLPPSAGACNAGTAGSKAYVGYTADYVFYKAV